MMQARERLSITVQKLTQIIALIKKLHKPHADELLTVPREHFCCGSQSYLFLF